MTPKARIPSVAAWTGLLCGAFALASAFVAPVAALAGGAGVVMLALIGWARGEDTGVVAVAALLGVAALISVNSAFLAVPMVVLALLAVRAIFGSLAPTRTPGAGA